MQLDKLQIELRPRPNAQALDLGFALLRAHAGSVYKAWLILWLPACAVAAALCWLMPAYANWWIALPWWLRPLLDRAPLYLLSRQVFGETVSWQQALRAWPRQLGGGWLRMLTWWRLCMPGRGLFQPVWLLEGARGKVAAGRRKVIALGGTGSAAFWFGVACAHFEIVLQLGLLGFIGIFIGDSAISNPFALFVRMAGQPGDLWLPLLSLACYAAAVGVVGPIYTACCFTLYLNRRATLEAWDLEIVLRQIAPPQKNARAGVSRSLPALLLAILLPALLPLLLASHAPTALAAAAADHASSPSAAPSSAPTAAPRAANAQEDDKDDEDDDAAGADTAGHGKAAAERAPAAAKAGDDDAYACTLPLRAALNPDMVRGPDHDARQAALRQEVRQLYSNPELRNYVCATGWRLKDRSAKPAAQTRAKPPGWLGELAVALKVVLIALALTLVAWLVYRYRDKFPALSRRRAERPATEVAGLDIRAESLPPDVTAAVRRLWAEGQPRAALALLYRATLSRLVARHGLRIGHGATEGDCLHLAGLAAQRQQLSPARLAVVERATTLWRNAAYGDRWPQATALEALCGDWQTLFDGDAGVPP